MSTKKTTQTTATFDPNGLSAYGSLQTPIQQGLLADISNPWQAIGGNAQLAASNNSIFGQSQQNNTNAAQSLQNRGISATSGIFAQQLQNSRNANAVAQNAGYNNILLQSQQVAQNAATAAGQYQPLQTGGTNVQSQSGLGTWLGPLAGTLGKVAGTVAAG